MITRMLSRLPLVSVRRSGGQSGARQGRIGGCKRAKAIPGTRSALADLYQSLTLAPTPGRFTRPSRGLGFEGGLELFHLGSPNRRHRQVPCTIRLPRDPYDLFGKAR
jgi:hypothetical protein